MTTGLRLGTLNTWKGEGAYWRRLEIMAGGLKPLNLDTLCLQEALVAPAVHADTAASLGLRLGMQQISAPAREKVRTFGSESVLSTSGLAILFRGEATGHAVAPLPSDPADGERVALRVDMRIRDLVLRLVNVHFSHLRGDLGLRLRREQADATRRFALEGRPDVVCLAGDFNAPLTAPELEPLTSDGLISAGPDRPDQLPQTLLAAGHETGRPEQGASPGRAIDHIVVLGGGARIVRRTLALTEGHGPDRLTASDHAAVIVELEPAILATTSGSN